MRHHRLFSWLAALGMGLAPALALGADALPEPYEVARSLRALQDRIAAGDAASYRGYRAALAEDAVLLSRAADDAWKEPRNVRAAVAFVLSGGEPVILKKLAELSSGQEQTLVRAALAYGENRNAAAAELLADLEPRKLDASIAGHVALVRSELLAKKDPDKALELLAEARLLAPGTMIEEAALRREAGLAADKGDADRFGSAAALYFRRFANSVHMGNFRRQFAANVVAHSVADDGPRRSSMEAALASLPNDSQQELYLMVAWEGVRAGKMELVRWAAGKAAAMAPDGSLEQVRAKLYEAAALVTTEELEKAMTTLEGISADKLDTEEEELLAAALHIGKEIRRGVEAPGDGDKPPAGVGVSAVAATARKAIARVDALLSGERR